MKQLIVTLLFIAVLSCNTNKKDSPTMIISATDTLLITGHIHVIDASKTHHTNAGGNAHDTSIIYMNTDITPTPFPIPRPQGSNLVIVNGDTLVNNSNGNDVHVSVDGNDISVEQNKGTVIGVQNNNH